MPGFFFIPCCPEPQAPGSVIIILAHEMFHAWQQYIGYMSSHARPDQKVLLREIDAVDFENYIRAMSGESTMRLKYGEDISKDLKGTTPAFYKEHYNLPQLSLA